MKTFPKGLFLLPVVIVAAVSSPAAGPPADNPDAAEISLALRKLNVVGRVLYVAAHPDDENTAFLAWASRGRLLDAAYLSMNRGDGGQNLIGSETAELLGVIRTQELLAARRIDGARQFFTRAIDFGYSKSPEETLRIWDHEKVLSDVVRVFRTFRPDIVVTRFPTTGEGGHGHHTASAILAHEAFRAAADPARFPDQIAEGLAPWQPRRLLWNVFRFGETPRKEAPGQVSVDLGAYNPLLGRSYTEIAAEGRSMHKSQGFGSAERRGSWLNDFRPELGNPPQKDPFDGIDLTWGRIRGSAEVAAILKRISEHFDPADPSLSVPDLLEADRLLSAPASSAGLDTADPLVAGKRQEVLALVRACLGLWTEAIASEPDAVPGGEVKVTVMVLNRSAVPVRVESVKLAEATSAGGALAPDEPFRTTLTLRIPADRPADNPYWLDAPPEGGLYTVKDAALIGRPDNPPSFSAHVELAVAGTPVALDVPVFYRKTDPVRGEVYSSFLVAPAVTANLDEKVYAFASTGPKTVRVTLRSGMAGLSGTLRLVSDAGFRAEPESIPFSFAAKGESRTVTFAVTAPPAAATATLRAVATVNGAAVSRSLVLIDYPHIPPQTLFPPAEARLVRLDLVVPKQKVGYVMGPGDTVPEALRQVGYDVVLLSDEDLEGGDLSPFGAIVTGVRAYDTRPILTPVEDRLLQWVKGGGTLVVQYNTTGGLLTEHLGPYPLKLSHDRVTVEEAPVAFLLPKHPLLNTPNRITPADFEGWVQERGLYFPGSWDPRYETPISCHDPGETDKPGGLLYTRYGKGVFIYTGYAFFRQLPAGVPGAYRLFVNLLSAKGN